MYFHELGPGIIPKTEGNPHAYGNFSWPELAKTI